MLATATGIVLSRRRLRESDAVARVLLESGQLLEMRLHGIQESRRRSPLIMEPLSVVEVVYYVQERGALHSLKEARVLQRHEALKNRYDDLLAGSCVAELSELAARTEALPELYVLAAGALGALNEGCETALLLVFFRIRLLRLLGLLGDLTAATSYEEALGLEEGSVARRARGTRIMSTEAGAVVQSYLISILTRAVSLRFGRFQQALKRGDPRDPGGDWMDCVDQDLHGCLVAFAGRELKAARMYFKERSRIGP